MRMVSLAVFAALLGSMTLAPAMAQDLIGTRVVADRSDHDTIPAVGPRQYRRVRLCVYDRPVHIYDLDIRFRNGGHQDAGVRTLIGAGECTRWIDLPGGARNITVIDLNYEAVSWGVAQPAIIRVYAD